MNDRRSAAFALAAWLATGNLPAGGVPDTPSRAFVQELLYVSIRRLATLRRVLGRFVRKWPKGEMEALLYTGAAQLLFMDGVPEFAAVNETVEAAKAGGNAGVVRAVNGILRNLARNLDSVRGEIASWPLEDRESYPRALVRRWKSRYGEAGAEAMAKRHNEPAATYLAYPPGAPESFVRLERGVKVADVPGFAEGKFIVQDPGAFLPVRVLDPRPGDLILDACAAPGGKTVQMCWRGAGVVACEVNPKRMKRLKENLARTRTEARTAGSFAEASAFAPGGFGKILVDAPCSNTGVLGRRVDARWNWSERKLEQLATLQREILDSAARMLAPGGLLVYSTCSNEPEENSLQARRFLSEHPGFALEREDESVPFESGFDGSYAAAFRKAVAPGTALEGGRV